MLSRFALILQRHFCIDYSQFKKTKWAKLTDRSLLVMQGPDIHKYAGYHIGCCRDLSQTTFVSSESKEEMAQVLSALLSSHCSCSQREKY